jgi:amino acid permease
MNPTNMPMSWISGGAIVINLVLGTGPFSYPQIFAESGFLLSTILLLIIMIAAFISAQFIVEAISVTCAKTYSGRS